MKTLLILICSYAFGSVINAQAPGTIDSSFGSSGKVSINYTTGRDAPTAIINLPDGRIIMSCSTQDFALVCLMPDGSPDKSFGAGGYVQTNFILNDKPNSISRINALALLPGGKFLAGGWVANRIIGDKDVVVARYFSNGKLDSSFGQQGIVVANAGTVRDECISLLVQPDNKIIAAGNADNILLYRFTEQGKIDSSFGINGKVNSRIMDGYSDYTTSAALLHNGNILLLSRIDNYRLALIRFKNNGTIDSAFGIDGILLDKSFYNKGTLTGNTLLIQPGNKILVAGYAQHSRGRIGSLLVRYLENGKHDATFGVNGFVFGSKETAHYYYAGALQNDGKIIAAGCEADIYGNEDVLIARHNANGTLDSSFGLNGFTVTDLKENKERIMSLCILPDTKIVAGVSYFFYNALLLRYNGDKALLKPHNSLQQSTITNVKIFPNPATNRLNIYGLPQSGKSQILVTDISGTEKIRSVSGPGSCSLNISGLQKGVYILHISSGSTEMKRTFIKE